MRVTYRCSRGGSAKHNDRNFDLTKAKHIDQGRLDLNTTWHCLERIDPNMTFSEAEEYFYTKRYSKALEATNARYRAQYHPERCKTIQDLLNGPRTRPDELILQVGNKDETVDPEVLKSCLREYHKQLNKWNNEHGRHLQILNYAIHLDESTPHIHQRQCWDYIDKEGHARLGQEKALEASGIELPDPDKPVSKYNNRKMTFDAMNRTIWQDILKSHGLEIETQPLPGRKNKIKEAFIDGQIAKKLEKLESLDKQIKWTKELRTKQREFKDK